MLMDDPKGGRQFFLCNVLKGGSTSWQVFLAENGIEKKFMADCPNNRCSERPDLRLLQVRHPLERLLATYRHLFKNGGWKGSIKISRTL